MGFPARVTNVPHSVRDYLCQHVLILIYRYSQIFNDIHTTFNLSTVQKNESLQAKKKFQAL